MLLQLEQAIIFDNQIKRKICDYFFKKIIACGFCGTFFIIQATLLYHTLFDFNNL